MLQSVGGNEMESLEERRQKLDNIKRQLQEVINSSDISIIETLGIIEVLRCEAYSMALGEMKPIS